MAAVSIFVAVAEARVCTLAMPCINADSFCIALPILITAAVVASAALSLVNTPTNASVLSSPKPLTPIKVCNVELATSIPCATASQFAVSDAISLIEA